MYIVRRIRRKRTVAPSKINVINIVMAANLIASFGSIMNWRTMNVLRMTNIIPKKSFSMSFSWVCKKLVENSFTKSMPSFIEISRHTKLIAVKWSELEVRMVKTVSFYHYSTHMTTDTKKLSDPKATIITTMARA